jgi:predicted transcriptional regulator
MEKFKTPLKDIMTPTPVRVSKNATLLALKQIYQKQKFHHHILVTHYNRVVGIISLLDFMHAIGDAGLDETHHVYRKKVAAIMTPNVVMMEETDEVQKALAIFLKNEIHAIPITENGVLKGIVTSTDVLRYLADEVSTTASN